LVRISVSSVFISFIRPWTNLKSSAVQPDIGHPS
jgi:hypothetical protein